MNGMSLRPISPHVYWMPPAKPDRPSLCAVQGKNGVLMLDGGASDFHARQFLDILAAKGVASPAFVALTHGHWDHVLGAAEMGGALIAHHFTAEKLAELAGLDWTDAGLEQQVARGKQTAKGVENIQIELPAPRRIRIAQANIVFSDSLELRLGDVTCRIEHVGGDHAVDSSIMFVEPDGVLFLGDCLYDAPERYYTIPHLLPLLDKLQSYDAAHFVEGHERKILSRQEFDGYTRKLRQAIKAVQSAGPDEKKVFEEAVAITGKHPDADMAYFLKALISGLVC